MIKLSINNSKEVAIKNSKWSNPGAKLYDKLLDAFYYEDLDNDDVNKIVNNPNNLQWPNYLKEAYLIAPIKKIKNSPYGRTPYSRSGCKYPHHVVKGDQLILDVNGVRAAYIRARQMGILNGDVETHIMSHIKELELEENLHITDFIKIEENFQFVESFIETFGDEIFTEASHGNLNNSFRLGVNIKNGHRIKIVFDLSKDDVTQIGSKQWNDDGTLENRRIIEPKERKKVISGIKKTGHNDFMSRATVLAIVDMDTNSKLKTVDMLGAMNSFLMNSTVMIGEDIIRKWESYFGRVPKPPFYVKFWQNTMELRELITSSFGWTRQLPKNDIKKFTVGDKEDIDGSFKSTKMTKDVWEFMNNVVNQTRTHNTNARGVKKESSNISEIYDDVLLDENFNYIEIFIESSKSMENVEDTKEGDVNGDINEDKQQDDKEEVSESLPKQTDARESNKNGVKRKQLYIAFIEYAKSIHSNNLFGSVFDKDAFTLYSFVPNEMRYFYRLANPLLCVLDDSLTFFALSELKKTNADNKNIDKMLIFAANSNKKLIVFNVADKKIYESTHSNNEIKIVTELAESFDEYIESLVGIKILNESFIFDI